MMKDAPKWLEVALRELGVTEISGDSHNKRILEYHATTSLQATDDETPWCSSFVNWCMTEAGLKGTDSAAARSWLDWGTVLDEPKTGCLVVLSRGNNPNSGHVGFFIELVNNDKHVNLLGGNQRNMVMLDTFPVDKVLAYIWPSEPEVKKKNQQFFGVSKKNNKA